MQYFLLLSVLVCTGNSKVLQLLLKKKHQWKLFPVCLLPINKSKDTISRVNKGKSFNTSPISILTAPARPDRDMEKKFGYAGDMIGPVFFSFRKQGDELWMMDPQYERVIENPEGTYAKIAAQRGNERLYKILPIKARNQGSSLIEIGEVLKDFPLISLI